MFKEKLMHLGGGVILMLLCATSQGAANYACASSASTWYDDVGAWSISQNNSSGSSASLSGTFVNSGSNSCSAGHVWAVTGTHNQDSGNFTYIATYVGVAPEGCAQTFTLTGQIFKGGCNTSSGSYVNSGNQIGSFALQTSCKIPSGETAPVFQQWGDQYIDPNVSTDPHNATSALFSQKLAPTSFNFGGRYVQEYFNSSEITDTCYFPGSEQEQVVTMPSKPKLAAGNRAPSGYGDWVGMGDARIIYYRSVNKSPCGIYLKQRMRMDCNSSGTPSALYEVHDMKMEQEPQLVKSTRGPTLASKIWGRPPPKFFVPATVVVPLILED